MILDGGTIFLLYYSLGVVIMVKDVLDTCKGDSDDDIRAEGIMGAIVVWWGIWPPFLVAKLISAISAMTPDLEFPSPKDTPPLCKSCRWCEVPMERRWFKLVPRYSRAECHHPAVVDKRVDLVSGVVTVTARNCEWERSHTYDQSCGKEGKLFEVRP